ncbi:hypothetical protein FACS189413_13240 [Bacteroidia bacterium]|nr:hypothetical protein FACS189413_13240 [Bacteroidia bacterium]
MLVCSSTVFAQDVFKFTYGLSPNPWDVITNFTNNGDGTFSIPFILPANDYNNQRFWVGYSSTGNPDPGFTNGKSATVYFSGNVGSYLQPGDPCVITVNKNSTANNWGITFKRDVFKFTYETSGAWYDIIQSYPNLMSNGDGTYSFLFTIPNDALNDQRFWVSYSSNGNPNPGFNTNYSNTVKFNTQLPSDIHGGDLVVITVDKNASANSSNYNITFTKPVCTTWISQSPASTNWSDAGNWNQGIPTPIKDVIIPSTANNPVLAGNATVANLTIEPGAGINLNGKTLTAASIKAQTAVNPSQWYSIGFPFAVTKIYSEEHQDELKAGINFWLREFEGTIPTGFTPENGSLNVATLSAGKGYIMQLPDGYDDDGSIISYSSEAVTVTEGTLSFGSDYALQANPTLAPIDVASLLTGNQHVYTLQEGGTAYVMEDDAFIQPFEAVITVDKENAPQRIGLNTGVTTGNTIVVKNDAVIATQYYNLQGVRVGALRATPLQSGVYIVKTVYESGKSKISKIMK